jgi:hypothetical protein
LSRRRLPTSGLALLDRSSGWGRLLGKGALRGIPQWLRGLIATQEITRRVSGCIRMTNVNHGIEQSVIEAHAVGAVDVVRRAQAQ